MMNNKIGVQQLEKAIVEIYNTLEQETISFEFSLLKEFDMMKNMFSENEDIKESESFVKGAYKSLNNTILYLDEAYESLAGKYIMEN